MRTWVGLLVIKDRKVLMIRARGQGYFMLPGGSCDDEQAAETALSQHIFSQLGVNDYHASKWTEYLSPSKIVNTINQFIVYAGELNQEIKLGPDIVAMEYVNTRSEVMLGNITYGKLLPDLQHRGLID